MKRCKSIITQDLKFLDRVITDREDGQNRQDFLELKKPLKEAWELYLKSSGKLVSPSLYSELFQKHEVKLKNIYQKPTKSFEKFYNSMLKELEGFCICSYCGRPLAQTLDHYLAKDIFPEFSFMPNNLVPSCFRCNLKKRDDFLDSDGAFYLHVYYLDDIQLIKFKLSFIDDTPLFKLSFSEGLDESVREDLEYQTKKLLLRSRLRLSAKTGWNFLKSKMLVKEKKWTKISIKRFVIEKKDDLYLEYKTKNHVSYLVYESVEKSDDAINVLYEISKTGI